MKEKFIYDGHEIVFHRGFGDARLIIDGVECDRVVGLVKTQVSSFDLYGKLSSGQSVHLEIKLGFIPDTANLYIDDKLVDSKKVV